MKIVKGLPLGAVEESGMTERCLPQRMKKRASEVRTYNEQTKHQISNKHEDRAVQSAGPERNTLPSTFSSSFKKLSLMQRDA